MGDPVPAQGNEGNANITHHTLDDIYRLIETVRGEFRISMTDIKSEVHQLTTKVDDIKSDVHDLNMKMDNIEPRVEICEGRIAKLEDDMDGRVTEIETAVENLEFVQEEYPVESTVVCIGLGEQVNENIGDRAETLVQHGLGLVNMQVTRAQRLNSRNGKAGIIKIELKSKEDKLLVLRSKSNLKDTGYRGVYIRSSMSHTDRIMQQNFQIILNEIPNGEKFRITANGKVVKKDDNPAMGQWTRGPPVNTSAIGRGRGLIQQ